MDITMLDQAFFALVRRRLILGEFTVDSRR